MGKIRELEPDLINKIAAGEVVERPASIIKETIENAIDAGADTITIEVHQAGKELIRIIDNGQGMDEEDAMLSIKSHATSKIHDIDDLFSVRTLGFRGEALASIAAVSHMVLTTKTEDMESGIEVEIEAGRIIGTKRVPARTGTSIIITDLFFNTPARKKHLKSDQTELGHISDIVTRYALSDTNLSIHLICDGKDSINCPGSPNLLNKIVYLYGKDTARQMIPIEHTTDFLTLKGLTGKPYLTKSDRSYQSLFVNGRYVKNQTISNAIYDAYHTLLFLDRNPVCVLFIEIDFSKTDVNVHPQKEIIRIENEDRLYKDVFEAMRACFRASSLIPDVELGDIPTNAKATKIYSIPKLEQTTLLKETATSFSDHHTADVDPEVTDARARLANHMDVPLMPPTQVKHAWHATPSVEIDEKSEYTQPTNRVQDTLGLGTHRVLGQMNKLYIIIESEKGLTIIDQHAAEERVFFEKFKCQLEAKKVPKQSLLVPKLIELSSQDASFIRENNTLLQQMGYELEEMGPTTFRIVEIPKLIGRFYDNLIHDVIADMRKDRITALDESNHDKLASMACRRAIKAGDELTLPQMQDLIKELNRCEKPFGCPHGRPTVINIPFAELERKFKRVH
ncbi:DNA mismatch repair endonuclease MutL [Candidatus Woesearchaeota archaeon]|nr:DNA mismatch repair endonuclease MutL [Candidatus Woesearchaeota archaeon]